MDKNLPKKGKIEESGSNTHFGSFKAKNSPVAVAKLILAIYLVIPGESFDM